jgi:hypothetical protein
MCFAFGILFVEFFFVGGEFEKQCFVGRRDAFRETRGNVLDLIHAGGSIELRWRDKVMSVLTHHWNAAMSLVPSSPTTKARLPLLGRNESIRTILYRHSKAFKLFCR